MVTVRLPWVRHYLEPFSVLSSTTPPAGCPSKAEAPGAVGWEEEQTEMKLLEHSHPLSPSAPERLCLPAARDRQHLAHRDTPRDSVTNKQ